MWIVEGGEDKGLYLCLYWEWGVFLWYGDIGEGIDGEGVELRVFLWLSLFDVN